MSDSRTWLVIGPPGTGKTRWLAEQCERAADKHGKSSVAIVSLTRAAAAEIAGRTDLPDENVGTLHAHCYRALDRPDLAETPEALREWSASHPHLAITGGARMLDDTIAGENDSGRTRGDQLHSAVTNRRARMEPVDTWSLDEQDHWQGWCDWKTQTGRVDFTDLIQTALTDVPAHPAGARVLLVDEAQDFSALELALVARWAHVADTTVIAGDPDQALYTWRGADPLALSRLDLAGTRVLEQSYRVPRAVHAAATTWIRRVADRADTAYHPTPVDGHVDRIGVTLSHPDALTAHIDPGQTTMILASCSYMLAPTLAVLRADGVPFHNPYRTTNGAWNPLRGAGRLTAFLRGDPRVWGDAARAWTWADLKTWTEPLQAKSALARGAKAFIEEKCRADRFGDSQADHTVPDPTLTTLLGCNDELELVEHPATRGDLDWYARHLRSSQARTLAYPLAVHAAHGGRALIDTPNVIAGTCHSVKGGQAEHVIISPDLSRTAAYDGWHPGGPGRDAIIRLFYVALTRASQRVTLLAPSGPEHVPLDDLLYIDDEDDLAVAA